MSEIDFGRSGYTRGNIQLSREEKVRFFYWLRDQAWDAMQITTAIDGLGKRGDLLLDQHKQEILSYLFVAMRVFPLDGDGETICIDDILNGREPSKESASA